METNPFAPLASTSRDQRSTPGDQNPDPQSAASSALDPGSSSKANSKRKNLDVGKEETFPLSVSADPAERDVDRYDERTPLMSSSFHMRRADSAFGTLGLDQSQYRRRDSNASSRTKPSAFNVNYPPSVPGTPTLGPSAGLDMSFGDVMIRDELARADTPGNLSSDEDVGETDEGGAPKSLSNKSRRNTGLQSAEDDVCFPAPDLSEVAEEGESLYSARSASTPQFNPRRRRRGPWPDLSVLDSWSRYEKEQETVRVKKITEPQLINGRLRAVHKGWYLSEDDAPYRFTYFNEELQSTIHSQSISGLVQEGGFRELFVPDPRLLSDDEVRRSSEPGDAARPSVSRKLSALTTQGNSDLLATSRQGLDRERPLSVETSRRQQVSNSERRLQAQLQLATAQGPLVSIPDGRGYHGAGGTRKVELFRNYYFVNYRTFDQDINSENYMEPVNMYTVVFREGIISFHFSPTPHAANVRRRIRQLKDYLMVSSDWISYAIIDDITDVFGPLIHNIEEEVDDIDECIMSSWGTAAKKVEKDDEKVSDDGSSITEVVNTADVLRRAGDCRKRVMSLYRLLGNKADVIKGFAKRCNEQWEVTPHSDIGLYLGDIQDHILTMTSNLSHYEMILARAHGNYLAQINLKMTERSEQTADSLNKLTVLGTIVLPMNIITGLWGMNDIASLCFSDGLKAIRR
ncbi:unnamed protein product [Parascedosporium putredinis]|uniref:Uncharacterized protein n=1 Tax=Parascedosporium putredinis TaxID=1442378 RepID=A0A9P1MCG0_9PEZI|nr:unnamed protein product [Parascedosporium putredinis]CAI7997787.1 unnamed protein product [Parascedosporium putredinis]